MTAESIPTREAIGLLWALREGSSMALPDIGMELFYERPHELTLACLRCDDVLPWRIGPSGLPGDDWPEFPTAEAAVDLFVSHLEARHVGYHAGDVMPDLAGAPGSLEEKVERRRYWREHGGFLGESFSHGMYWPEGAIEPQRIRREPS